MASIFHPASLGLFAQNNHIGTSFYKDNVNWLPAYRLDDLWYDAGCPAIGVSLKDYSELHVSSGLGIHVSISDRVLCTVRSIFAGMPHI